MGLIHNTHPTYHTHPTYIIGPKSASEHVHPKYNKHIYIFGDYHARQHEPCGKRQPQIPIHKWIDDFSRKLPHKHKLDLFLEIPEKESGYRPLFDAVKHVLNIQDTQRIESYLQDTIEYFKTLNHSSVRVHFTDLRESCLTFPRKIVQTNVICMLRDFLDALSLIVFSDGIQRIDILKRWLELSIVQNIIRSISMKNKEDIYADILSFEKYCHIEKHIENIREQSLVRFFKNKLLQARKKTEQIFTKMLLRIRKVRTITDVRNLVIDFYGDFLIQYMDLWILVQIFEHSEYQHNVIYVGHIHANQYRQDLKQLGFKQVQYNKSKNEVSCIRINK